MTAVLERTRYTQDPTALYHRGTALLAQHDFSAAIECADKILAKIPNNDKALHLKATCLADLKQYEDAIKCAKLVVDESKSKDPYILTSVSFMFKTLGNEEYMKKAIAMIPEDFVAQIPDNMTVPQMYEKAMTLYQINAEKYNDIIVDLVRRGSLSEVDQSNVRDLLAHANCLTLMQRNRDAVLVFEQVLKLNPTLQAGIVGKVNALYQLAETAEELQMVLDLISVQPAHTEPVFKDIKADIVSRLNK
jgi:tetratricopeptide (TPR) repeat protein